MAAMGAMVAMADMNVMVAMDATADMVAMARAFLSNPRWVWDAAKILNHSINVPPQYARRL